MRINTSYLGLDHLQIHAHEQLAESDLHRHYRTPEASKRQALIYKLKDV
jgi:hypothetical protein